MKIIVLSALMVALSSGLAAQTTITTVKATAVTKPALYNPSADAARDIDEAVKKAAAENKFVLIQAGGNWCKWCYEFQRMAHADVHIDSILKSSFIVYHLNYSKENMNKPVFAKYDYPQRFGFPVFIILNGKGEKLHIQNSEYLEDGKTSYDPKKVLAFLISWTPASIDPAQYK